MVLLPPEAVCRSRVAARVGHGSTDDRAARRRDADVAGSDLQARHLLTDLSGSAADVAGRVSALVAAGTCVVTAGAC